ncbi:MAG: 5'-nucleotidase C-terminal domain-containing protein [Deltaproteobacteria bacterium]|nr:5'-nucleotidase C-terminal domain-containing protein [Deltaproteobacteria bacterium]
MARSPILVLTMFTLGGGCGGGGCGGDDTGATPERDDTGAAPERLTILHTNDVHAHLMGYGPEADYTPDVAGDDDTIGGIARIAAMVDRIRTASDHPVLLVDAGDWRAGSLFQLLDTTEAPGLQVFQAMGYDATTIGDHEWDWGSDDLAATIAAGDVLGVNVPIVASNMVTDPSNPADDAVEALLESGRVTSTWIAEKEGLRVGLMGLLGEGAAAVAPAAAPVTFTSIAEAAASAVTDLGDTDIIVVLSHSGLSEDLAIAEAVPDVDVIVGGHTHTVTEEAILAGWRDTVIVQAGAYGAWLGQLDLVRNGDGWAVDSFRLHAVDDGATGDAGVTALVDGFVDDLDSGPLAALGTSYFGPVAEVPGDVTMMESCSESGLGNLVTDAFRARTNALRPDDPVDFAFEAHSIIRDDLLYGTDGIQRFADVFRVLPLGSGWDGRPGRPLVAFWITADELVDVCEITASICPTYGCDYFVEVSGLRCHLDMERSQFNRARSVDRWTGTDWEPIPTGTEDLYHVTVDTYVGSVMGRLESLTYGGIVITPKDAVGKPVPSVAEMVFDADAKTDGVQELELWEALLDYLASFEDTDGDVIPNVPDTYLEPEGRYVGW